MVWRGAGDRMKQWGLIVDVARCTNCQNCVLATKDEYIGNSFPGYSGPMPAEGADWVVVDRVIRGGGDQVDVSYVPRMCQHCADAPCMRAPGGDAIRRRADGIVLIDPIKARGRRELVDACPYGAIHWNQEQDIPQAWNFDAHLIDQGWTAPRCVQACPTGALTVNYETPGSAAADSAWAGTEELRPELHTRPLVRYRNLQRAKTLFLGGTVVHGATDQTCDNLPEAVVELSIQGAFTAKCKTDAFGQFKFDGLVKGSSWAISVTHGAMGPVTRTGSVGDGIHIGLIHLREGE